MQHKVREYCIDSPLRHTGHIGELVNRSEGTVDSAVFDDARRKRGAYSGQRCKRGCVRSIQIDCSGGRCGSLARRTRACSVPRRFALARHGDLFTVADALRQIHARRIGIGTQAACAHDRILSARPGSERIETRMNHGAGNIHDDLCRRDGA